MATNFELLRNMTVEQMAHRNVAHGYVLDKSDGLSDEYISCYTTSDGKRFLLESQAVAHEIEWLNS